MLVDPIFGNPDPLAALLAIYAGRDNERVRLAQGVYDMGHFSGDHELDRNDGWLNTFELRYPDLKTKDGEWFNCYGVCDNYQQILDQCPVLQDPQREFVIMLCEVRREDQPDEGGWRWHKWGPYIGTFESQCEYLYDEVGIDSVFCYHIYERAINHD